MKYRVNEACIGCGLCTTLCPHVFSMSDAGVAEAINHDIDPTDMDDAENAMNSCPVEAIEKE